jgi:hypothetical protein
MESRRAAVGALPAAGSFSRPAAQGATHPLRRAQPFASAAIDDSVIRTSSHSGMTVAPSDS